MGGESRRVTTPLLKSAMNCCWLEREGGRPPWRALLSRPSSSERASGGDAGEKERERAGGDQEKLEEAQCEDDKQ